MNLNSIWSMLEESYDNCSDIGVAGIGKFAEENHLSAGDWSWVPAIILFPDEPISSVQWKCEAEGTTHSIRFSMNLAFAASHATNTPASCSNSSSAAGFNRIEKSISPPPMVNASVMKPKR